MASSTNILTSERLRAYSAAADKALAQVKRILEAKQNEMVEYDSLIRHLDELAKKRSASVMCPIGSVGFLPATINHTNEILVGLGDGYFVDTSAYHAVEILRRRKKVVENNIDELHQHENIIVQQITFAKEIFDHQKDTGEIEIREEYDEEKEEELRKKRRSRVTGARPVTKTVADIKAEAEMMKRLEELERQELRNGELDSDVEDVPQESGDKRISQDVEDTNSFTSLSASGNFESPLQEALSSVSEISTMPSSATISNDSVSKEVEPNSASHQEANNTTQVGGCSVGVFSGEDLIKALTEQSEIYDENGQIYQPPPGVSSEDYQKLLKIVEDINTEDSSSDRISEEDGEEGDVEGEGEEGDVEGDDEKGKQFEEGSELDSDDLSAPEAETEQTTSKPIKFGKFTAQNVGPSALPTTSMVSEIQKHRNDESGSPATSSSSEEAELTNKETQAGHSPDDNENDDSKIKKKKKRKKRPKKKKSVMFAEQLEDATLIDSQAPPSETRSFGSTSTSQSTRASILVNSDEKSPVNTEELANTTESYRVILPGSEEAFSGVVMERNAEVLTMGYAPAASTQPSLSKPQSLFRAKRLHNNV